MHGLPLLTRHACTLLCGHACPQLEFPKAPWTYAGLLRLAGRTGGGAAVVLRCPKTGLQLKGQLVKGVVAGCGADGPGAQEIVT